jgi:N-acetylglucosamine malate deacetylase 2
MAFRPHVVVTFGPDGITGHPDHLAIGAATTLAFARLRVPLGSDGPTKLYYVVPAPGSEPPVMQAHAPPLPPTTIVHAPEYADVKRAALRCHRTQVADVDAIAAEEGSTWLTTDHFFRAFPQIATQAAPENDILADL